ncbi:hypothetical protein [Peribacillus butanolivorans]|uniref:hypothetical protein n=1 Tax=Peribacillus butanolivorans TaxID=421767 RepID=UPI00366EBE47
MASTDKIVRVVLNYFCPSTGTDGDGDLEIYGSLSSVSGSYSGTQRQFKQSFTLFQRDPNNPDKIQVNVHRNNVGRCLHEMAIGDWLEIGGILAEQDGVFNDPLGTYSKILNYNDIDFTQRSEILTFQDSEQVIQVEFIVRQIAWGVD